MNFPYRFTTKVYFNSITNEESGKLRNTSATESTVLPVTLYTSNYVRKRYVKYGPFSTDLITNIYSIRTISSL
jgi:hypothetical protein